eukprot:8687459-Alexandrium_andersonii.AAC.1
MFVPPGAFAGQGEALASGLRGRGQVELIAHVVGPESTSPTKPARGSRRSPNNSGWVVTLAACLWPRCPGGRPAPFHGRLFRTLPRPRPDGRQTVGEHAFT